MACFGAALPNRPSVLVAAKASLGFIQIVPQAAAGLPWRPLTRYSQHVQPKALAQSQISRGLSNNGQTRVHGQFLHYDVIFGAAAVQHGLHVRRVCRCIAG